MSRITTRVLYGVLFAGGITLLGATAANAAETSGEDSILGGTQAVPVITAPIQVDGLSLSLFGDSATSGSGATAPVEAPVSAPVTGGADGIASGSQVAPVVTVPVDISDVAVSVFGDSSASSTGASSTSGEAASSAPTTEGTDSVAGGTQVAPVVTAPIDVSGVAVSLLGDSSTTSVGNAGAVNAPVGGAATAPSTTGNDSVAGGSQIGGAVTAPISVGGVALAPFGDATTTGSTGSGAALPSGGSAGGATTEGEDSLGGGTQVVPVITAPIDLGGIAVSLTGDSEVTGGGSDGATVPVTGGSEATTSGNDGILGGTQIAPIVTLPISIGDIAISVTGDSETGTPGGGSTDPGTDPGTEGPGTGEQPDDTVAPGATAVASGISLAVLDTRPVAGSQLAWTGADVSGLLAAAGMVLLLGAALLVSRRLARNSRG
ncbi:hypothetical protein [Herbiconiux sp. L3-i23]|uniref:hypothetical protein n=1 Tax=Herbiconiux sp. L3-i23 TaxID=2905871 RepID=UPI002073C1B5|nr:hypothetical protein [Herbiconiux sp. L3-i23]